MQVLDAPSPDQISAANGPGGVDQPVKLTRSEQQATDHPAVQRVERDAIQAHQARGARIIADAATRAQLGTGHWLTVGGLDRLERLNRLGPGADGKLRAQAKAFAGLAIHPMVSGGGIGDALVPAHPSNPGRRRVEGALCRGQQQFVALNIQLAADGAGESCAHRDTCCHSLVETERGSGASSPCLKAGVSAPHVRRWYWNLRLSRCCSL